MSFFMFKIYAKRTEIRKKGKKCMFNLKNYAKNGKNACSIIFQKKYAKKAHIICHMVYAT